MGGKKGCQVEPAEIKDRNEAFQGRVGGIHVAFAIKERNSSQRAEMLLLEHPHCWRRDCKGLVFWLG